MTRSRRKFVIVASLLAVLTVMGGITSYSVTLYRLFCQATGANGTTQRVAVNSTTPTSRVVTVFFDTSVAPGMPWRFEPVQRSVKLHLGEDSLAFFEAKNLSGRPIVGHATFNVTPAKVGLYFKKIQCFCFNEERLEPGQSAQMPVTFFVDPRMADDPDTEDVHEITLSYTFFESRRPDGALDLARFTSGAPEAVAGAKVFASDCSGCHALDHAVVGPALGDVVGRRAGSIAGYPYSRALTKAGIVWTPAALNRWLADPQAFLPGAQMPMKLEREADRQAVIAYLESLPKPPS
jgi:cytochrome c oxidase assembly protein Cox11/cytochrome c2